MRYVEEAFAEGFAQVKVNGLNAESVLTGIKFPLQGKNAYVKLLPNKDPNWGRQAGLLAEATVFAFVGYLTYKGFKYSVVVVSEALESNASHKLNR